MKKEAIEALTRLFGEHLSVRRPDREEAATDESGMAESLPDCVVYPETTEDVVLLVAKCLEYTIPLTARGGGTSLSGNPIPVRGGVVMDTRHMNRVVRVSPADMMVTVQPGVTWAQLNAELAADGLFLAASPGSAGTEATIGGMVANNASGPGAIKYGPMRRHVMGLVAVTGEADVIRTGHRCKKASSGYDLTGLLVGSEGTLAIVCEVTLSLTGLPAHTERVAWSFPSDDACVRATADLVRSGLDLAACEYLDAACIAALNEFKQYGLAERPSLFVELHGATAAVVDHALAAAQDIARKHRGETLAVAGDPWAVRHWVERAVRSRHPGTLPIWRDVAFPLSELPNIVSLAHDLAKQHGLNLYTYGHAGMGILYVVMQEDPNDPEHWDLAEEAGEELVQTVIDKGGSCSAHSGIGLGNRPWMRREHGIAVKVMERLKAALDPANILNPGKILP